MENKVIFSVVIPTRNRESSLRNLVDKINEQTLVPDEIIIVDSSEKRQSSYNDINKSIKYLHKDKKSAFANFLNLFSEDSKENEVILNKLIN
jgi:glycosyltransferase involved in cell wall biosynthesis